MKKNKLLFIVNTDWFFLSHRLPIAQEAINQGYEVHIATKITNKLDILKKNGLKVHPLNIDRSNSGVKTIILEFKEMFDVIRTVTPDIVHLVTIKPVLIGGIASRILNVSSVVFAISGLGYIFLDKGFKSILRKKIITFLYKIAFKHKNKRVIFQNNDDKSTLIKFSKISSKESLLIQGSGVNLSLFTQQKLNSNIPIIMLCARLLKDKGVLEFVQAAKLVNGSSIRARFVLVGEVDLKNPSSITHQDLEKWERGKIVEHWGQRDDMNNVISSANIVVLPSYREGFPKILIEAAACGRAVITTNVPGCRDAIKKDVTGMLVPAKDYKKLAIKISYLLDNPQILKRMGDAGRKRAEELFDINEVVKKHLNIYSELLLFSNNRG